MGFFFFTDLTLPDTGLFDSSFVFLAFRNVLYLMLAVSPCLYPCTHTSFGSLKLSASLQSEGKMHRQRKLYEEKHIQPFIFLLSS